MTEQRPYDISWGSLWKILFFIILVSIMYSGRRILIGLFLAIVISSGLEFIVDFLERRGVPRTLGVILIFLSAAVLVIMTVYTVIPLVVVDLNSIFMKIQKPDANSLLAPFINFRTTQSLGDFVNKISTQFLSGGSPLGTLSDIVGSFALAISVLISSFYLSLTRNGVERFIRAVVPIDYEPAALRIYEGSIHKVGVWFRSQLLLSLIVGGLVLATLLVLKVKFAFLLAALTAIFELVPYIGPLIAGSAAVLAAILTTPDSLQLAVYTLIAFVIIHELEANVLVPIVVGRNVGLHPVIVIIALLIGLEVGGFLGLIISVPVAVVLQEMVIYWSEGKRTRQPAVV